MNDRRLICIPFAERPWQVLVAALSLLLGAACSHEPQPQDCPAGMPVPIASDTMAAVVQHHFERRGQESFERIALSDGTSLELYQSGCRRIRQEFRFYLPAATTPPPRETLAAMAARRFRKMAGLSPAWVPFGQWADALEDFAPYLQHPTPLALSGGISLRVDAIESGPQWWLIVVMEQRLQ